MEIVLENVLPISSKMLSLINIVRRGFFMVSINLPTYSSTPNTIADDVEKYFGDSSLEACGYILDQSDNYWNRADVGVLTGDPEMSGEQAREFTRIAHDYLETNGYSRGQAAEIVNMVTNIKTSGREPILMLSDDVMSSI